MFFHPYKAVQVERLALCHRHCDFWHTKPSATFLFGMQLTRCCIPTLTRPVCPKCHSKPKRQNKSFTSVRQHLNVTCQLLLPPLATWAKKVWIFSRTQNVGVFEVFRLFAPMDLSSTLDAGLCRAQIQRRRHQKCACCYLLTAKATQIHDIIFGAYPQ